MTRRHLWFLSYFAVAALLEACGHGNATADPTQPQISMSVSQITMQPASQTVSVGRSATFSVLATGTPPLHYQWRRNGAAIVGATGSSYTTPAAVIVDNGLSFTLVVTNVTGSITSNAATLTVTATPITPTAPQITTPPANQTVSVGQTATFSVVATGSAPLQYQWQENGTAIAGATGPSYTTAAAASADTGSSFTVVVTNATGSKTSNAATLTVTAPAGTDVVTYKYDLMRTGQNLSESALTPSNVASATFGKLRNLMVDGLVDAQPLYLSKLTMAGAAHNVVFVATEQDSRLRVRRGYGSDPMAGLADRRR